VGPDVSIRATLDRRELRELFREPLERIRRLILELLDDAGLLPRQVDRVVLAGGSSALVCVRELLGELFGRERVPDRGDLYTSVAGGLALAAAGDPCSPAAPALSTA
jgi:molecular chaperone DnaK (HSP70)